MMKFQKYFLLLPIALSAIVSLYFWGQTTKTLLLNHSLSRLVDVNVDKWEVEEIGSDQYALIAHFAFDCENQIYRGKTRFVNPLYINPDAAIAAVKMRAVQSARQKGWYCPTDPNISSLEKNFPQGPFCRAAVASAIFIYLIWMRRFSQKKLESNKK